MAKNDLLVLTGATGFLGFKTLVLALEAGYNVRIVVRSAAKASKVLNSPSIKALNPSAEKLSHVIVENMEIPGAFDEALKGATYVIHCASPIPSFGGEAVTQEQYNEYFIQPAVRVTIGLLESCRKAGTIRRVVITSSVAANIPWQYYLGQGDDKIFTAESRIPVDKGPYESEFQAYSASKAAALNESEAWIAKNKPNFDLISILPGWIWGYDELATSPKDFESSSTNSVLLGFLRGSQTTVGAHSNSVLVDDAAKIHVLALDPKIPGNQAFLAVADSVDGKPWEEAIPILKKNYPEAIEKGLLKTTGKQPTIYIRLDGKKTEQTFGFKLAGYEEQVKSLVDQYLQIVKA
ncbi:NAD(P)-binding protein [Trichoderma citrinoviride]|uniref:NAD(P)-binding protein n=1 Tax=Trichoderma citrinoviride TaxID=58853 RepID=A0A2T4B8A2_9HYPO|nr:NAD(P)-binding protein [Trichoderma citrinoviride]PTB65552.1 NAD(P)-binding protein [Trichoderma citrinoviride]